MQHLISVIICTHNPRRNYFERVLQALKAQTLAFESWELLLIDNASDCQLATEIDINWHPHARCVREDKLGLTSARVRGIQESIGEIIVFVDDDNVLHPNYLRNVINIFQQDSQLGVIGGKSIPEFEVEPARWVKDFWVCLALRDLGENIQIGSYAKSSVTNRQYPLFAPIGAGMALRSEAAQLYIKSLLGDSTRQSFDRTGQSLQSGGDCDINLTLLDAGWAVGYFPELELTHLIPPNRVTKDYLARLNRASSRSWVQVLDAHNIYPWQKISRWSVLPRKIKAFFRFCPWRSSASYIQWQGACGLYEGLALISK